MTNEMRSSIIQAIEHYKHGIDYDIFSEPVTTYARLAIEALKKELKEDEAVDKDVEKELEEIYNRLKDVKIGDTIVKQIEEGHCIITYSLIVTSIEKEDNGYLKFFGTPLTFEDSDHAEDYGYGCGGEEVAAIYKTAGIDAMIIDFLTQSVTSEYAREISEQIRGYVYDDMIACSGLATDEDFSDTDVKYAIGRALRHYMDEEKEF